MCSTGENLFSLKFTSSFLINRTDKRGRRQHPMHLHGHDFYVLGSGQGNFSSPSQLNFVNPTRRDVAMLPANGWLVLAFETINPGAWLMHCHIVSPTPVQS